MRFFGRGKEKEHQPAARELEEWALAAPPPSPVPILNMPAGAYRLPEGVTIHRENGSPLRYIENRADAKEVSTALKLLKKRLQLEKRTINAEMQAKRSDYRLSNARRGRTRGGGDFGKMMRGFEAIGRDSARRSHASKLDTLDEQKAGIDSQIYVIDQVLLEIEAFVLSLPEEPKPAKRPRNNQCPSCGNAAKATDKFCPECGEPLSDL